MNYHLKILLFLSIFKYTQVSTIESVKQDKEYEKYFKEQEVIYQQLENLGIPGARPLVKDEFLAESVLANCSKEVDEIMSDIEFGLFSTNKKNIIFHGPSGTGKSILAQAIAIKSKTPCLFFNVGTISTEYKDSGVQNLSKIFKRAQDLEKVLNKPCIIIFDELEALTKKHVGTNNSESNILISFWQELDKLRNCKIIVIGTMNNTEDVPEQIINRTSMIEISLPNLKQIDANLSYHLKKRQDTYKIEYPAWLTSNYLARKTKGFCNRDLENLVEQATKPVIKMAIPSDGSNKIVQYEHFARVIRQIKKDSRKKWLNIFKKHFFNSKITLPCTGMAIMLGLGYCTISHQKKCHKENIELQKANHIDNIVQQEKNIALQIAHQKENLVTQKKHQEENVAMQEKNMAMQATHHKDNATYQEKNLAAQEISLGIQRTEYFITQEKTRINESRKAFGQPPIW